MRTVISGVVVALTLLSASPSFAWPVLPEGLTIEEMAGILTRDGYPAKIGQDSNGTAIISSRASEVNFDVYFYQCASGRCRDIQYAAGWSSAYRPPDQINQWNTTKRFLRVYWKPGNILWAEQDARISRGTTENIDETLTLWSQQLIEFKKFMGL